MHHRAHTENARLPDEFFPCLRAHAHPWQARLLGARNLETHLGAREVLNCAPRSTGLPDERIPYSKAHVCDPEAHLGARTEKHVSKHVSGIEVTKRQS